MLGRCTSAWLWRGGYLSRASSSRAVTRTIRSARAARPTRPGRGYGFVIMFPAEWGDITQVTANGLSGDETGSGAYGASPVIGLLRTDTSKFAGISLGGQGPEARGFSDGPGRAESGHADGGTRCQVVAVW
jgi:hypothetical protein